MNISNTKGNQKLRASRGMNFCLPIFDQAYQRMPSGGELEVHAVKRPQYALTVNTELILQDLQTLTVGFSVPSEQYNYHCLLSWVNIAQHHFLDTVVALLRPDSFTIPQPLHSYILSHWDVYKQYQHL